MTPHTTNRAPKHGEQFTRFDEIAVIAVTRVLLAHQGPNRAATEKALAREAGLTERRFRAIATGYDGTRWLLGKVTRSKAGAGGVFLATNLEDARALDAELASKQETLSNRLGRRAWYAEQRATPAQMGLWRTAS